MTIPQRREYGCYINGTSVILHDRFKYSGTRYTTSIDYSPHFEIAGASTTIGRVVSDWVQPIQRLMMFLSSYYAHVTEVRLQRDDSDSLVTLHLQTSRVSATNPTHMLLYFYLQRGDLERMGMPLGDIVKNWFQLEDDYPYLAELFGTLASNGYLYDDVILLLLFRAIESYHDNTMDSKKLPSNQHRAWVQQMVAHIPCEDDRNSVYDMLIDKNRKSLLAVLNETLDTCGEVGRLIAEHHPKLVRTAIRIRNNIAHTGRQNKETPAELAATSVGLVWIVTRIVTERVLGSGEAADDYISNNWIFKSYVGEPQD